MRQSLIKAASTGPSFFFEPCNKYIDLVWIKKVVFELLVDNLEQVDKEMLKRSLSSEKGGKNKVQTELDVITEPVLAFETRSKEHMINLLSGAEASEVPDSGLLASLAELYKKAK